MKRLNPIGSLLGYVLTGLLFVGLGASLWFDRGLAFSPGPVTAKKQVGIILEGFASHADFEKQCGNCHDPLRTSLAAKCLECHTEIQEQIQSGQGVHSQLSEIDQCATCHPEHRGRNFDPTLASFQLFDHSKTSFSLTWHQTNYDTTPMQCNQCHNSATFSTVTNQTCQDCHIDSDKHFDTTHLQNFGSDCLGCHDGVDRMRNFDHSSTGFPLVESHAQIQCTECHATKSMEDSAASCVTCHAEPSMHQGVFDPNCGTCHSMKSWSPASLDHQTFGHLETAGFSLKLHQVDYSNQAIICTTCHPQSLQSFDLQTCTDCHSQHDATFMSDHISQFGSECMVCHDGVDRLSNFQHINFFPLEGKHATLQCGDCHTNQTFRGTPGECWQCHKEPEIHAGIFGLKCDYCHTAYAWSPATLQRHIFPLDHGVEDQNSQLQCVTCHATNYIDITCYNCHEHQQAEIERSHKAEGISQQDVVACTKCHPSGYLTTDQQQP